MNEIFTNEILRHHTALIGKTGSGKTSTGKLIVEHVVPQGARVCILDPIKSDWWGLISSADGKKPGLPFHIIGGPRGHVPLHSSAGRAIGELVATGKLPLSIIDMRHFEPGGLQRFFVDFAPTILEHNQGVLYLVIEEAHEFAPKERSGVERENMAIYYAKKLATAGRSQGIRMMVSTQRVQALHNALLGSCENMIVHRLTAPADQDPVKKWLKANTPKDVSDKVSDSLASLKTGTGWLCSGEAQVFELVQFPRIKTYDNSATPTYDSKAHKVASAPVNQAELRDIIGEAVVEAEANDPNKLKAEIATLKRELAAAGKQQKAAPAEIKEVSILTDKDKEYLADVIENMERLSNLIFFNRDELKAAYQTFESTFTNFASDNKALMDTLRKAVSGVPVKSQSTLAKGPKPVDSTVKSAAAVVTAQSPGVNMGGKLGKAHRAILTVLTQHGQCDRRRLAILAGYTWGGTFRNVLSELRSWGYMLGENGGTMSITDSGMEALGPCIPMPTGEALIEYWKSKFGKPHGLVIDALMNYPNGLDKDSLTQATNYAWGGTFRNVLSDLRAAGVLIGKNTETMRLSDELLG